MASFCHFKPNCVSVAHLKTSWVQLTEDDIMTNTVFYNVAIGSSLLRWTVCFSSSSAVFSVHAWSRSRSTAAVNQPRNSTEQQWLRSVSRCVLSMTPWPWLDPAFRNQTDFQLFFTVTWLQLGYFLSLFPLILPWDLLSDRMIIYRARCKQKGHEFTGYWPTLAPEVF